MKEEVMCLEQHTGTCRTQILPTNRNKVFLVYVTKTMRRKRANTEDSRWRFCFVLFLWLLFCKCWSVERIEVCIQIHSIWLLFYLKTDFPCHIALALPNEKLLMTYQWNCDSWCQYIVMLKLIYSFELVFGDVTNLQV